MSELEKLNRENELLRKNLENLMRITENLVSTLDIDELLETLVGRLAEITNADGTAIALFDDGNLIIKKATGVIAKFVGLKLPKEESFSWRIINEGKTIFQRTEEPTSKIYIEAKDLGISTSLGIPLKRFNRTIGVLSLHWLKPYAPTEEEIHLLEVTAERITLSIMNAQQFEQIKLQAQLIDLSPSALIIGNLNDMIMFWNKSAEEIYVYTKEEAIGKKVTDLIYTPEQLEDYFKAKDITLKDGKWSGELKQKTKDGRTITVWSNFKLLIDEEGKQVKILVANTDITEKKKIEALLNRAHRLEAIGRLAAGIAHDLNNILQPITMASEILRRKSRDEAEQRYIEIINSSAQRGAQLVKQVLTFSKGISGEKGIVQVKHLIREVETILKETFPKNIKIEVDIQKDLWAVVADPNQIMQVLMNLCVNAKDAMPNGGKLAIKAQNLTLDNHYATQIPGIKPGPYILITVEDTGVGIPAEIIDKIFEPFFTTKEPEKGTGLGLSTVNNIIKEHDGFINVYSEVGQGTIFKVYLPASSGEIKPAIEEIAEEIPVGDQELILIAEDEAPICLMIKTVLEDNNYRTITANNGAEALVKFIQNKDEIALIITDLEMPVMDGVELIKTVRKIEPKSKIIATSGLDTPTALLDEVVKNISVFIQKPFDAKTLLKETARVLKS
jgi:two-component system, cell cycle sensor histidine kinase and response regulator CckA